MFKKNFFLRKYTFSIEGAEVLTVDTGYPIKDKQQVIDIYRDMLDKHKHIKFVILGKNIMHLIQKLFLVLSLHMHFLHHLLLLIFVLLHLLLSSILSSQV